jgi:signal transduction histidine kinase
MGRNFQEDERLLMMLDLLGESVNRLQETNCRLLERSRSSPEAFLNLPPANLSEVARNVRQNLDSELFRTGARVETDFALEKVNCPPRELASVVFLLLKHALSDPFPNPELVVKISCQVSQNYQILTVADNGAGTDPEQKIDFTERYYAPGTFRPREGLELYIVRRTAEHLGGRFETERQPGVGSTFRVYFRA